MIKCIKVNGVEEDKKLSFKEEKEGLRRLLAETVFGYTPMLLTHELLLWITYELGRKCFLFYNRLHRTAGIVSIDSQGF